MNILAIGCHPDDLEIGCGGTLARFAQEGHAVYMAIIANGNVGHAVIPREELRVIRQAEALRASQVLGAQRLFMLDVSDLEVDSHKPETVRSLVDVIRQAQPDLVISHAPDDYMRDHVEVSRLVFDASFSASVPHYATPTPGISKIPPLFYMDTLVGMNFIPTEYVDITATIEVKLKALECHESQVKWMRDHDGIDFHEFVRSTSRFRGLQSGVMYAEGFRLCLTWPRLTTHRMLPG